MKVGRMIVCFVFALAVNSCLFLAGFVFAGFSVVAVAVPVASVLSGMMLYWNEDKSFKKVA